MGHQGHGNAFVVSIYVLEDATVVEKRPNKGGALDMSGVGWTGLILPASDLGEPGQSPCLEPLYLARRRIACCRLFLFHQWFLCKVESTNRSRSYLVYNIAPNCTKEPYVLARIQCPSSIQNTIRPLLLLEVSIVRIRPRSLCQQCLCL